MAFNVRVIDYPAGKQVRVYYKPVDISFEKMADDERAELEYNPFTGEKESIPEMPDEMTRKRSQRVSMARTVNRLYYLARSNKWEWFVTLTFSPEKVNRFDYDACVKLLSKWLNNCKRKAPGMAYLVVPEQHKSGAWHFHGLFYNCNSLGFHDSGKKDKNKNRIYNIGAYRSGFTTATRIKDMEKVSKYISKYITKELCAVTFGRKRFWASRNLEEAPIVDYCLEPEEKKSFLHMIADYIKHMSTKHSVYCRTDYIELCSGFV